MSVAATKLPGQTLNTLLVALPPGYLVLWIAPTKTYFLNRAEFHHGYFYFVPYMFYGLLAVTLLVAVGLRRLPATNRDPPKRTNSEQRSMPR